MATCCLSQTGAIFVLFAISKPCIRFRRTLYRFQPNSPHLSNGTLGFPSYCHVHHFPSEARIRIAYHILHIIHALHHVACAFLVIDCGSVACVLVLGRAGRRVREWGTCRVRLRGSSVRQLWEPCRQDDHPSISLLSLLCQLFALLPCSATYHLLYHVSYFSHVSP